MKRVGSIRIISDMYRVTLKGKVGSGISARYFNERVRGTQGIVNFPSKYKFNIVSVKQAPVRACLDRQTNDRCKFYWGNAKKITTRAYFKYINFTSSTMLVLCEGSNYSGECYYNTGGPFTIEATRLVSVGSLEIRSRTTGDEVLKICLKDDLKGSCDYISNGGDVNLSDAYGPRGVDDRIKSVEILQDGLSVVFYRDRGYANHLQTFINKTVIDMQRSKLY